MDREAVFTTRVYPPNFEARDETPLQIQKQLEDFIYDFRLDNKFIYRYVPVGQRDTCRR